MRALPGETLLVDADDTLWENHAYFLEVHANYLDLMEERGHRREQAASVLRDLEHRRTIEFGYGSINYARSLVASLEELEGRCDDGLRERFLDFGRWIHHHPIELLAGVQETLEHLAPRHRLFIVTKGNRIEQLAKIERSGVKQLFSSVEILEEKDVSTFRALAARHALDPRRTWMVGNSPRSDMNPARAAGLMTVYVPHTTLWEFEHEDLDGAPDLHLAAFRELCLHF